MPITQVSSPSSRYLSATDILIGDMSDINYEFLIFDRPVILLANQWIRDNWPDFGIKTNLNGLSAAIKESLDNPGKWSSSRKIWLQKTIFDPFSNVSSRIIDKAIELSEFEKPLIVIIDGNSEVRKSNLMPLYNQALKKKHEVIFQHLPKELKHRNGVIYFAVHFEDLIMKSGYKVHLDHGLKGKGAANVRLSIEDYQKHRYFPLIDLHITAGEIGDERTKMQLGSNSNRTWIGGYPKAEDLKKFDSEDNRNQICQELCFDPKLPIITYASAGPLSYEKPGGSFSSDVLNELKKISETKNYNLLIKLKYSKKPFLNRLKGFAFRRINEYLIKSGK